MCAPTSRPPPPTQRPYSAYRRGGQPYAPQACTVGAGDAAPQGSLGARQPARSARSARVHSARVETGLGTYSVHHVQPAFFDGFASLPDSGIKLAVPEKALVDFL